MPTSNDGTQTASGIPTTRPMNAVDYAKRNFRRVGPRQQLDFIVRFGTRITWPSRLCAHQNQNAIRKRRRTATAHPSFRGGSGENAFKQQLEEIAASHPALRLNVVYSRPGESDFLGRDYQHPGHVDVDLLRRTLPHGRHQFYYVCRLPAMMQALVPVLAEWGVPEADIHYEAFGPASIKLPGAPEVTRNWRCMPCDHPRESSKEIYCVRGRPTVVQVRVFAPHSAEGLPVRQAPVGFRGPGFSPWPSGGACRASPGPAGQPASVPRSAVRAQAAVPPRWR